MSLRIVICINTSWNIVNFRSGLIARLRAAGHEVIAIAPRDAYSERLTGLVDRYIALEMDNRGTNPLKDLRLYFSFVRVLKDIAPDVYLGYTIKPNIFGSLAAHRLGIPVINNISGLGATFMQAGFLNALVKRLYRIALKKSRTVFFQNADDQDLFVGKDLVRTSQARLLAGSGVDLQRFHPMPLPADGKFRFLLISRLLWDKGVGEFVQAARTLRARYPQAEFALLGACDVANPAAISRDEVAAWEREGVVAYLGETDRVKDEIEAAHCVVLPSYREGTPRALLEAAACARPVITTDVPGCKEVVINGETGLLCRAKDAADLAAKMGGMLQMSREELAKMGRRSRALMEAKFDERLVIDAYLQAMNELTSQG